MIEFTILLRYNGKTQKAGVVKSENGRQTEYNVRPQDPTIVQKLGKQIIVFKENENFNTNIQIDDEYKDFFNSLVDALRQQDADPEGKPSVDNPDGNNDENFDDNDENFDNDAEKEGGPDVPGEEQDDMNEEIGQEDEENNYYSLGGDKHD